METQAETPAGFERNPAACERNPAGCDRNLQGSTAAQACPKERPPNQRPGAISTGSEQRVDERRESARAAGHDRQRDQQSQDHDNRSQPEFFAYA